MPTGEFFRSVYAEQVNLGSVCAMQAKFGFLCGMKVNFGFRPRYAECLEPVYAVQVKLGVRLRYAGQFFGSVYVMQVSFCGPLKLYR